MTEQIRETVAQVRREYSLDDYKADKALIAAPFGQGHLERCIAGLSTSKAVRRLAEAGKVLVIIVTSREVKAGGYPREFQIIQIDKIPSWPSSDRQQNRFLKWSIPFLFVNIRSSIYLDSDIIVTNRTDKLLSVFDIVERHHFFVTAHVMRRGWMDEYDAILNWLDKVDAKRLEKQKILFQSLGIPRLGPVFINKFVGRLHDSQYNILSEEVLRQLFEYSDRDQLALIYAMHKDRLTPFSLPEGEILFTGHVLSLNPDTLCFYNSASQVMFKYLWKRAIQAY